MSSLKTATPVQDYSFRTKSINQLALRNRQLAPNLKSIKRQIKLAFYFKLGDLFSSIWQVLYPSSHYYRGRNIER